MTNDIEWSVYVELFSVLRRADIQHLLCLGHILMNILTIQGIRNFIGIILVEAYVLIQTLAVASSTVK